MQAHEQELEKILPVAKILASFFGLTNQNDSEDLIDILNYITEIIFNQVQNEFKEQIYSSFIQQFADDQVLQIIFRNLDSNNENIVL